MNHGHSRSDHEYAQELIENESMRRHEEGECEGVPTCGYCLDAWYESNKDAKELRIEPKPKSKLEQEDD